MNFSLILKNGNLVTPKETFKADIAVKDGIIAYIGKMHEGDTAGEIFDAAGLYIFPGIIDAHVHLRDPGLTEKEDFRTGSLAAAFGGITTAADMPNTVPDTSTAQRMAQKIKIAQKKSYIDFALFALLREDSYSKMPELQRAGALGFKVFLGTSTGDIASPSCASLFEQMKLCSKIGMRIGFHAETSGLNEHFTSAVKADLQKTQNDFFEMENIRQTGMHLSQARPVVSEVLAVSTAVCYARYTGAKIHIHHVSCRDSCEIISLAKSKGIDVSAETCPHYLLLNAQSCAHKVYPPVREEAHRLALWEAIKDGTIDMIASDHAPHTAEEKSLPAFFAPAGLCGTETMLPLMLNEVKKGSLSFNDLARLLSEAPAKIWGIYPKKGCLAAGSDADFSIVNSEKKQTIDKYALHSKSKTSPYDGMEVQGSVAASVVRGKFIVKDGKLAGESGYGRLVRK